MGEFLVDRNMTVAAADSTGGATQHFAVNLPRTLLGSYLATVLRLKTVFIDRPSNT